MTTSHMNTINWDMVIAITTIMAISVGLINGIIVLATKWIFITKKDHEDGIRRINAKLYDKNNLTIFLTRLEYNKDAAENAQECKEEHLKIWASIKNIETDLVRRPEWEHSKEDRERRRDLSQRNLCKKMGDLSSSINDMRREQNTTNKSLNKLMGSLDPYPKQNGKGNE